MKKYQKQRSTITSKTMPLTMYGARNHIPQLITFPATRVFLPRSREQQTRHVIKMYGIKAGSFGTTQLLYFGRESNR